MSGIGPMRASDALRSTEASGAAESRADAEASATLDSPPPASALDTTRARWAASGQAHSLAQMARILDAESAAAHANGAIDHLEVLEHGYRLPEPAEYRHEGRTPEERAALVACNTLFHRLSMRVCRPGVLGDTRSAVVPVPASSRALAEAWAKVGAWRAAHPDVLGFLRLEFEMRDRTRDLRRTGEAAIEAMEREAGRGGPGSPERQAALDRATACLVAWRADPVVGAGAPLALAGGLERLERAIVAAGGVVPDISSAGGAPAAKPTGPAATTGPVGRPLTKKDYGVVDTLDGVVVYRLMSSETANRLGLNLLPGDRLPGSEGLSDAYFAMQQSKSIAPGAVRMREAERLVATEDELYFVPCRELAIERRHDWEGLVKHVHDTAATWLDGYHVRGGVV